MVLPKGPLHTFLLSWKLLILIAPPIHNSSLCCFGIHLIDWHLIGPFLPSIWCVEKERNFRDFCWTPSSTLASWWNDVSSTQAAICFLNNRHKSGWQAVCWKMPTFTGPLKSSSKSCWAENLTLNVLSLPKACLSSVWWCPLEPSFKSLYETLGRGRSIAERVCQLSWLGNYDLGRIVLWRYHLTEEWKQLFVRRPGCERNTLWLPFKREASPSFTALWLKPVFV